MFWNKPTISKEDHDILAEAKARIELEREKMAQERRLYQVLVDDPLDFDSIARIGKRSGALSIEIVNNTGAIVRFNFANNSTQVTNVEEEKAIQDGVW